MLSVFLQYAVVCVTQGSSGFLDLEGAFKHPGKAGLRVVLLWLCCAHHSCPQSRGRNIESGARGEAVRPR